MTRESLNTPEDSEQTSLYQQILHGVVAGVYPAGAKLSEKQLGRDFNVGRIPLRECLFQLYKANFLEYEPNKGFRVPRLSREELRECYPIIWALEKEVLAASFGLLKCHADKLTRINAAFAKAKRIDRSLELDREFHSIICGATCNSTLIQVVGTMKRRVERYDRIFLSDSALIAQSAQQHEALIAAIIACDLTTSLATLEANWRVGLECLLLKLPR